MKDPSQMSEKIREKRDKKRGHCLSVSGRKTVSGRKLVRLECIILL